MDPRQTIRQYDDKLPADLGTYEYFLLRADEQHLQLSVRIRNRVGTLYIYQVIDALVNDTLPKGLGNKSKRELAEVLNDLTRGGSAERHKSNMAFLEEVVMPVIEKFRDRLPN